VCFDGREITAQPPLAFVFCVGRTFINLSSITSDADGLIEAANQNCRFIQVSSEHHVSDFWQLDLGAGGNMHDRCEINDYGKYGLRYRRTAASPAGAFALATSNTWHGGDIERPKSTSFGAVLQEAGSNNTDHDPGPSMAGYTGTQNPFRLFASTFDGTHESDSLTVDGGLLSGAHHEGIRLLRWGWLTGRHYRLPTCAELPQPLRVRPRQHHRRR
jgi:hypothetical protein